ncbi:hypothetical protein EJV47_14940 [Hymenobacter gummosus]|uniref:Uncharacterized protein n=1 Tax=Hymenobacter gummosus TaxID=1776032 RepID=A0A431U1A5_9BACT|nr:hypothetical protein [Hymenobacter gummosus]RTQ48890.1 hypothetical protein EJV47_14940 [Hymenobacter gummosus]
MSTRTSSYDSLVNALAALAGVAAAAVVKWALSDHEALTPEARPAPVVARRDEQLALMRQAAHDPQYLADMREVNDDFAFADAEQL